MKRTDITALFPNATDEQIKAIMDINGADINAAKSGVDDVRKQLDAANSQLEAAKKAAETAVPAEELKKANDRAAALEKDLASLKASNEIRDMRFAVAKEKGLPAELLTGETQEICQAQADAILAFAKPSGYPNVKDGGEINTPAGTSTRDQFARWAETQF